MYQPFLTFIKSERLFEQSDKLLVAVSGGVDSMVLVHLLHHEGFEIGVAHINYGLRGEQSDRDMALVEQWCLDHNVPLFLKKVHPSAYEQSGSIQMVARQIRYDFFDDIIEQEQYKYIATAHNLNDSLETVLLNLTKGTGLNGLTGIAAKRNRVVRPLLFAAKSEIYDFARNENLIWREDQSNAKNDYQRNLIRNEIVPLLKKLNPNLEDTYKNTQERLQGSARVFEKEITKLKEKMHPGQNGIVLNLDWYDEGAQSRAILFELIKEFGFNYNDVLDLTHSIKSGVSGKIFYTASHKINFDRNQLIISARSESSQINEFIPEQMGNQQIAGLEIILTKIPGHQIDKNASANIALLDADQLQFPLQIRTWQQGDWFQPLGLNGSKKVSDYLIDQKVSLAEKERQLVILSEGKIVWLVGRRLDNRFKVSAGTHTMLRLEVLAASKVDKR